MTLGGNGGSMSRWGTMNDRRSSNDRVIREVLAPYVCNEFRLADNVDERICFKGAEENELRLPVTGEDPFYGTQEIVQ